ncbi:restriction endonuclease subunit S [Haliea sp.]|uniref:restriction endonuclease subunit S n=1 Tax=Haliea sp. TaxID=1932666 RepID=UPI003528FCD0
MKIEACIHDGWMLLRNFRGLDKEFAYWLLLHERMNLVAQGNGSVFTNLKTDILRNHRVLIPAMEEQKEIAKLLNCLSDKIQINVEINQTLEKIAQAIFKSWFVDFDPVKAKIAAKERWLALQPIAEPASPVCYADEVDPLPDLETYMTLAAMQAISGKDEEQLACLKVEQPEQYAELRATAELFPSAMQDSELGEIPEGWTAGALADVVSLNRQSWTRRTIPPEIRYVDLANTKNGVIESTTIYRSEDAPSRARRILSDGDTIVGTVRPGNCSFAFIKQPQKTLTGSTGFAVLSPNQEELAEFVYITATSDEAINHLARLADGGAYPAVRPEVVVNLPCVLPCEHLIARFHTSVRSFFDLAVVNKVELSTLSELRDSLLPKLLSGELLVTDTEAQIVEAEEVANV